jgi:VanZ family protein
VRPRRRPGGRRAGTAAAVVAAVVVASLVPLGGGGPAFPDGLFHVVGYAAVAAAVARTRPPTRRGLLVAAVVAFGVGAGVELVQSVVPGRTPSLADAGANLVGSVAGAVLTVAVRRSRR